MFLVGHTAVGIALASMAGITHPAGAFAAGWLSHYMADFFPHGDESLGEWAHKQNTVRRMLLLFIVDAVLVLIAAGYYISVAGFSWWAAAAAIGATIPDFLWGLELLLDRKLFGWHHQVHAANHNVFAVKMPLWMGVTAQSVVTLAIWYFVAHH